MGFLDAIGWPRDPVPEQRMITSVPGMERPGFNFTQLIGLGNIALPSVTTEIALTVPAFGAGVAFLSRSLASLPLHAFRNTDKGPVKIAGGLETLIHEAPNAEWTSFKLRQYFWQQVFTGGRGLIWIERSGSNITGLYPMNPCDTTLRRDDMGRTFYSLSSGKEYPAADVIDVPFMLASDGLKHFGPVVLGMKALQIAIAMGEYGAKFFAGGGVPPLALVGPMPAGPDAMKRALADVQRSIDSAKDSDKPLFPIPPGYELKPVGFDPDKGQMTDARRFQVEEIARVLQIPPVFLQDLSHGTYSNSEQQDLHLVKHLIGQWVQALEEEMNLKLFGQRNGGRFVEHNLDGLMRGDFITRMNGLGNAVQNAILTPDEARGLENRPAKGGNADKLFIQGATVPIDGMTDQGGATAPVNGDGNVA
jgi:HK97 family phage portal protein